MTSFEKLVADYCGLSIPAVQEMDFIDYLVIRRDAFINRMSQSEEGEKYLDNAFRLEQTKPDYKKLRAKFGG